jgi:hypothetical protein
LAYPLVIVMPESMAAAPELAVKTLK